MDGAGASSRAPPLAGLKSGKSDSRLCVPCAVSSIRLVCCCCLPSLALRVLSACPCAPLQSLAPSSSRSASLAQRMASAPPMTWCKRSLHTRGGALPHLSCCPPLPVPDPPAARAAQVKTMSEALVSPTQNIATSPIVDGVWKLIFTTTTGSSGGKLGSAPPSPPPPTHFRVRDCLCTCPRSQCRVRAPMWVCRHSLALPSSLPPPPCLAVPGAPCPPPFAARAHDLAGRSSEMSSRISGTLTESTTTSCASGPWKLCSLLTGESFSRSLSLSRARARARSLSLYQGHGFSTSPFEQIFSLALSPPPSSSSFTPPRPPPAVSRALLCICPHRDVVNNDKWDVTFDDIKLDVFGLTV